MIMGRKIIAFTFVGRKRFLELLKIHMLKQRDFIDEWVLCWNVFSDEDKEYVNQIHEELKPWTRIIDVDGDGNWQFGRFYPYLSDPDAVYMKVDDDIVWMEPDAIKKLVEFRISNPQYSTVSGNIINNVMMSYLHQRHRAFKFEKRATWDSHSPISWSDGKWAQDLHFEFLKSIKENTLDKWRFPDHLHPADSRYSINAISYFGKDLLENPVDVLYDDENYISTRFNMLLGRRALFRGAVLFSHFSFNKQIEDMDKQYELLHEYRMAAA